ncbi:hypothetical protein [Streptantibioticus cattleyicolor]|uniref:Uncharacterized protein n=1 Tax=Streptantibioticus cattleyicolor (strain ATCC 35852 / DSM 46488 / JCM 4925 / NBRC 14057 / NRRL 8057) TaxID=1003195 RepID=F8JJT8_STREN|nr:hypothetical protein [Streptantibioticus cattleyicolor]AEW98635.1 hypothetical protein SCATT_p04420 [Streptantibioticus cattleyicolor NRRL 8057 = DSM 46488]CCB72305.1 protein of unknown function [Streptantibioticus cattleyicolor NRRL 8057 = DSM 46488]
MQLTTARSSPHDRMVAFLREGEEGLEADFVEEPDWTGLAARLVRRSLTPSPEAPEDSSR